MSLLLLHKPGSPFATKCLKNYTFVIETVQLITNNNLNKKNLIFVIDVDVDLLGLLYF